LLVDIFVTLLIIFRNL